MAVRPTYAQMERLIKYMEDNYTLAQVRPCQIGVCTTKRKFKELAWILNSMEGLRQDKKEWARFWIDSKYKLKRRLLDWNNTTQLRVGHGVADEPPPFSELERRILQLVTGKKPDDDKKKTPPKRKCTCESAIKPKHRSIGTQTYPEELATYVRRSSRIRTQSQNQSQSQSQSQSQNQNLGNQRLINIKLQRVAVEQARASVLRKYRACKKAQN